MWVHQLCQRFLVDNLYVVHMVVKSDLLVQKLPQGIHKGQAPVEVFIIDIADLMGDRGTSTLGQLSQELGCYLVTSSTEKNLFEVILKGE